MLFLTINAGGEQVRSTYGDLPELVAAVEALGERDGWPGEVTFRISLVIDELAQNVVDYSHEGRPSDVEVEVTSLQENIVIEITDDGIPFNPLTDAPEPDLTSSIEDRPIGGLGVYFMKTLMDHVEYCRESGRNRLKIIASKKPNG